MTLSTTDKLHKTRISIRNHIRRTGHSMNNVASQNLVDRYNDLIDVAKNEMPGAIVWNDYCKSHGFCPTHNGYDLWA